MVKTHRSKTPNSQAAGKCFSKTYVGDGTYCNAQFRRIGAEELSEDGDEVTAECSASLGTDAIDPVVRLIREHTRRSHDLGHTLRLDRIVNDDDDDDDNDSSD